MNTVLKELDLSGGEYDWMKCDAEFVKGFSPGLGANGALVSANLLNNKIGIEQAQNLATILKEHAVLKSLCGNKGDETALDMSGKSMGADGAIMLAPEIVANGALVKFDISNNDIRAEGGKALAEALKDNQVMQELNISSNELGAKSSYDSGMSGVIAISDAIPTMGALTSLNISNNKLTQGKKNGTGLFGDTYDTDMSGIKALAAAISECK